jgi:hypothetical protein
MGIGRVAAVHRRQVLHHQPVLAQFATDAVGALVAHGDELLVRRQMDAQRADGQRFHTPRAPCRRIAAGKAVGIDLHRALDRHAGPLRHFRARPESRRAEPLRQVRHHEVRPVVRLVLLDQEWQVGDAAIEWRGQQAIGVQVAHGVEDFRHLGMEHPFRAHRGRRHALQPRFQQAQPLHRIHRMHGHLERQVGVVLLKQYQRLVHQQAPFIECEVARRRQEIAQR